MTSPKHLEEKPGIDQETSLITKRDLENKIIYSLEKKPGIYPEMSGIERKTLEKTIRKDIKSEFGISLNYLKNMPLEAVKHIGLKANRKSLYFDIGNYTTNIVYGLSAIGTAAGAYYDKPEYIAAGAVGFVVSLLYKKNLKEKKADYQTYLRNLSKRMRKESIK
jgi:hypothetical protein